MPLKSIIKASAHKLKKNQFDPDALEAVSILQEAGFVAYIVGGCIRDLLLKETPQDFDISTDATPEDIKEIFGRYCRIIGRRFRLAHLSVAGKVFEVSTFRRGEAAADEILSRDNEWGTEEEDALRRDFTINGLFYDPSTETIIDHVGGMKDLDKKILRVIGTPFLRFKQDPVRMIRLFKFCARFNLDKNHIEPSVLPALLECREDIAKASEARVFEECLRMLESGHANRFFVLLREYGFFQHMFQTLSHFFETEGGEPKTSALLETIDELHNSKTYEGRRPFSRPILIAALTFPYIENLLKHHSSPAPALIEEIRSTISTALLNVFAPFFNLPYNLRVQTTEVLLGQYRMALPQKGRKLRVPNEPNFGMAIKFLEIRGQKDPELLKTWKIWRAEYEVSKQKRGSLTAAPQREERRPRRRKRR